MTPKPFDSKQFTLDVQCAYDEMSASQQVFFRAMVSSGESPRMAAMFALRQAPVSQTESDLMRDGEFVSSNFEKDEDFGRQMVAMTRKENPNFNPHGKVLVGSLIGVGSLEEAWAPAHEVKSHMKGVCEKHGRGISGAVNVKGRDIEFVDEKYEVADDLVEARAREMVALDPGLKMSTAKEAAADQLKPEGLKRGPQGIALD